VQSNSLVSNAGFTIVSFNPNFALARYKMDGSLDMTFGTGGKVTTDFVAGSTAEAVALQTDGKIVAAGPAQASGGIDFALARYEAVTPSVNPPPDTSRARPSVETLWAAVCSQNSVRQKFSN
jgi:uncharacterized delta-60 repeat protein